MVDVFGDKRVETGDWYGFQREISVRSTRIFVCRSSLFSSFRLSPPPCSLRPLSPLSPLSALPSQSPLSLLLSLPS